MKKSLSLILTVLSLTVLGIAQTSNLTATITDSDGQTWNNGTAQIVFVPTPGVPGPFTWQGSTHFPQKYTATMNGSGTFTASIPDNLYISPKGSLWQITLCSNTSAPCQNVTTQVTGASPNLSSLLSAAITAPRFGAGPYAYGYLDAEVSGALLPGMSYFNVTNTIGRQWNGAAWQNVGSGTSGNPALPLGSIQGNNAGAFAGTPNSTIDFTTGAVTLETLTTLTNINADQGLSASSLGPWAAGSTPLCIVDGINNANISACITWLNTVFGSAGDFGTIWSFIPEDFTTNVFAVSKFRGKVVLFHQSGTGDTCATSAPFNCWMTEVPLVLPTHLVIEGQGNPSRSQGAFNSGTVISFGTSFPAPLGPPATPSLSCSSTGGNLSNGTYYVQIWYVNNLLGSSNNGNTNATPGYGLASTETNVICAGGTSTQKITFSMPAGAGSGQYAAQDVAVGVALSGDGAATAASNGTGYEQENHYGVNLGCNTQGVVDTNACAISGGGTITISGYYTQSSQAGMPPPEVDLSNPMITLGTGIPGIANNAFSVRLQHLTLSGMGGGTNTTTPATNEPAVLLSDFVAQEQSGCDDCTFTGPASQAYLFTGYKGGNSYYSHIHMPSNDGPNTSSCAAPVCDGQWIPVVIDGRGASNGGLRWGNDLTIAARCSGCGSQPTTPEMVLIVGTATGVQIASIHVENDAGGDGILVDKAAGVQLDSITGFPNSGKCMMHLTATGNVDYTNVTKDGKGYCAEQDDANSVTITPASNQGAIYQNFTNLVNPTIWGTLTLNGTTTCTTNCTFTSAPSIFGNWEGQVYPYSESVTGYFNTTTANTLELFFFKLTQPYSFNTLSFYLSGSGSAGTLIGIGIYNSTCTTRLVHWDSISAVGPGHDTTATPAGGAQILPPGDYYWGVAFSGTTPAPTTNGGLVNFNSNENSMPWNRSVVRGGYGSNLMTTGVVPASCGTLTAGFPNSNEPLPIWTVEP